jgi:hypothetical protein
MKSREELEARVEQLEREVAALRSAPRRVRKRATWGLGNLPIYEIAVGPDPERGEARGHARAVLAVGDIATGFVAAVGGLAIGGLAIGGGAVGAVAIGGGAVGQYACGGGAVGEHVISANQRDPEAEAFFREHGLEAVCLPRRARRR